MLGVTLDKIVGRILVANAMYVSLPGLSIKYSIYSEQSNAQLMIGYSRLLSMTLNHVTLLRAEGTLPYLKVNPTVA